MYCVYVAGAYSADNVIDVQANMRRGLQLSLGVLQFGLAPFCPWLDFTFGLLSKITIEEYYAYSMAWLEKSDAVIVVPEGAAKSKGTCKEIERAHELGIPVFTKLWPLLEWKDARDKE